jgi:hypothetical protein
MCVYCIPEAPTGPLRRAVPKIPAKSSVPPGLPLNKSRALPTRSESTLPQLLIPLHFKSRISNTYKKPGEGAPRPSSKVLQLVTTRSPVLRTHSNARNPNPLYRLLHDSLDARGVGARPSQWHSHSLLLLFGLSRIMGHGTRATALLVPRYRCAATRKVPESRVLQLGGNRETFPLPRCLMN